jgi:hypothetical protein
MARGRDNSLAPGEIKLAAAHSVRPHSTNQASDYCVRQVEKSGLMPAKSAVAPAQRSKQRTAKRRAAKSRAKRRR